MSSLPSVFFFLTVSAFGCFRIIDTDVWLYLKTGEYICHNLRVPRTDFFSYSAAGESWIDVHWLAQAGLWAAYAAAGAVGLTLLRLALVLAIFVILYRCCRAYASPTLTISVLTLSLLISNDGFLIKPHLISLLLAASFISLLDRTHSSDSARVWLLVPLQVLWVNTHPSFLLGPFLILVYLLDIRRRPPAHATHWRKRLALILVCASASCILNPYGFSVFPQPWLQTASRVFSATVIPWTPPSAAFPAASSVFFFKLMLTLCIASAIVNIRNARASHAVTMAVFAFLSMRSRRHMPLFALLAAPGLAYNLAGVAQFLAKRWAGAARVCGVAGAVLISLLFCLLIREVTDNTYYVRQRSLKRFGLGKSQIAFPDAAMDFLDSSRIEGRVFCNYDIGSYFAGRFYPRRAVFIDGRNLVYGETLFQAYLSAMGDIGAFDTLAEKYGISAALLTHSSRDVRALLPSLWKSNGWIPVYADARAVIFLRNRPGFPAPSRLDLSGCRLSLIHTGDSFPIEELRAGELFFTLGLRGCARDMLNRALAHYPSLPEAHNMLGLIAVQEGNTSAAITELQQACRMSRAYAEPRINLATVLLGEGDAPGATREARDAVRIAPSNALAHSALGLAYLYDGKPARALGEIEEAVRLDPGDSAARKNLAAIFAEEGFFDKAREHLEEVIRRTPGDQGAGAMLRKINAAEANKNTPGAY
ncbi:MAG: tetratricopeptide repeat protein [Candidatus Aureabacteria bacterium]|nr:tetratricopeptide repeat protein [Candidatus Auribacterota bacterium]